MNRSITALILTLTVSILPTSVVTAYAEQGKNPIILTLFLHDELTSEDARDITRDYLPWFIRDLQSITGRTVEVKPVVKKPGITNYKYHLRTPWQVAYEWDQIIARHIVVNQLPRGELHKYVLITRKDLDINTSGIAYAIGGRSAVAALTHYQTLSHEIGHLFGATHSDGRFHWNAAPVPCVTIMYWAEVGIIPPCYRFSEKSADAIRNYLKAIP